MQMADDRRGAWCDGARCIPMRGSRLWPLINASGDGSGGSRTRDRIPGTEKFPLGPLLSLQLKLDAKACLVLDLLPQLVFQAQNLLLEVFAVHAVAVILDL